MKTEFDLLASEEGLEIIKQFNDDDAMKFSEFLIATVEDYLSLKVKEEMSINVQIILGKKYYIIDAIIGLDEDGIYIDLELMKEIPLDVFLDNMLEETNSVENN